MTDALELITQRDETEVTMPDGCYSSRPETWCPRCREFFEFRIGAAVPADQEAAMNASKAEIPNPVTPDSEVTTATMVNSEMLADPAIAKALILTELRGAVDQLVEIHGADFATAPRGYGLLFAFWPMDKTQQPEGIEGDFTLLRIEAALMADEKDLTDTPVKTNSESEPEQVPGQTEIHDFI